METKLFKHNEEAYKKIAAMIAEKGRAAVVHPTGTGKMFIAAQWLVDHPNDSFLFMAPTYEIIEQFEETLRKFGKDRDDFPFLTTAIYEQGKKEVLQRTHFDKIVLDEFHRCGAPVWGETVNTILDYNKNAEILGLSATPVRVLDNQKDMADILFKDAVASTMTLEEAMVDEILPCPIYICSQFTCKDEIAKYQKKVYKFAPSEEREVLLNKLDVANEELKKIKTPSELLKEFAPKNGKFIIFCEDTDAMIARFDLLEVWCEEAGLKMPKLFCVSASQDEKVNKAAIAEFENDKSEGLKLMFSVNKLNEGVHINGVDGVMMFRHTTSPILYRQQLGRALSCGKDKQPIIFDFVDNYLAGNQGQTFFDSYETTLDAKGKRGKLKNNFVIVDQYRSTRETMEEIDLSTQMTWSDWFQLAKNYYEKEGDLLVPKKYVDEKENRLGQWIASQRTADKNNMLPAERKQLLDSIGMVYDIREEKLKNDLKVLDKYLKDNNITINEISASAVVDGFAIGKWIENAKSRKACDLGISDELTKALEQRGINWSKKKENSFYEELAKVVAYITKTGKKINEISRKEVDENGFNVGLWLRNKRVSYRANTLEDYKFKELEKRGIAWDLKRYDFYRRLNIIDQECKAKDITINDIIYTYRIGDFSAGAWMVGKKSEFKKGNLPTYQAEEFEKRKINWDTNEALFYQTLDVVKKKCKQDNISINDIGYNCYYEDVAIGKWLCKKNTLNTAGTLPNYQKKELKAAGYTFRSEEISPR